MRKVLRWANWSQFRWISIAFIWNFPLKNATQKISPYGGSNFHNGRILVLICSAKKMFVCIWIRLMMFVRWRAKRSKILICWFKLFRQLTCWFSKEWAMKTYMQPSMMLDWALIAFAALCTSLFSGVIICSGNQTKTYWKAFRWM